MRLAIIASGLALCLAACGGEPEVETPLVGDVMPILPLPPNSSVVTRSGGEGALLLKFFSTEPDSSMVEYYRNTFARDPWVLISDTKSPDGSQVLYVERNKQPMWVRIYRAPGTPGSMIELSGAVVESDSTLVDSLTPESDTIQAATQG